MRRRYTLDSLDDWTSWETGPDGPDSWLQHPLRGKGEPRKRDRKKEK